MSEHDSISKQEQFPNALSLHDALAVTERSLIEKALIRHQGRITATAETLGLSRQGLYKKMKRLDIEPDCYVGLDESTTLSSSAHGFQRPPQAEEEHPIQLDHAALVTRKLKPAIEFYTTLLGLQLERIEPDPIRKGRKRALLTDSFGDEVIELIEMPEMGHPNIQGRGSTHHIGFRLTRSAWLDLRDRLDENQYGYQEIEGRLFVRDVDGLMLEIEQL